MAATTIRRSIGLGGLLVIVLIGCTLPTAGDKARVEFLQSRREAKLSADLDTANAKLFDEQRRSAVAATQAVSWKGEFEKEQIRRQIEKDQYELTLRLNVDLKRKLEKVDLDRSELKTLQEDVIRLNKIITEREADIARLREELAKLKKPG